jgi:hypothetical protein
MIVIHAKIPPDSDRDDLWKSNYNMCIRKDARELDLGQKYADTRPQTTVNSPQQYSIGAQAIIYLGTCS